MAGCERGLVTGMRKLFAGLVLMLLAALLALACCLAVVLTAGAGQGHWWNFETCRMEALQDWPATDEQARKYIPQDAGTQLVYLTERMRGATVPEAMAAALRDAVRYGNKGRER